MHPDELYESWKRRRAQADIPADFTERVMAALPAGAAGGRPRLEWPQWFFAVLASPLGRAGLCALACLVFALRLGSVIALFLALAGKAEGA
jgi:hypothetical protein